jgi:DNA-binding beta-propeller fold protein YncE
LPIAAGWAISVLLGSCTSTPAGDPIALPNGSIGIGFDDLRYSSTLHRVLVPGGRTGILDLVDPDTFAVTPIDGFRSVTDFNGGHDDGPTSVDEGDGHLFVTDRTSGRLSVVDPRTNAIVGATALASRPDYVRFVAPTHELWVTEPGSSQLEIFSSTGADPNMPEHSAFIGIANGPESLVIDATRGKAYTHRWQASTVAVDLANRTITAEWPNGCAASRGIALDEMRGFLFVACLEGTTSVLDVDRDGAIVSSVAQGSGFDVIGYNAALGHLYLAGSACRCLVTLGVSVEGKLSFLGREDAPAATHCVTSDDVGHAWVCDPDSGEVRRVTDSFLRTLP